VGAENFFLFGLSAEEVSALKSKGYNPWDYYNTNELRQVIDSIASGCFSSGNPDLFRPIVESLLHRDEYLHLADYQSYVDQEQVATTYRDQGDGPECRFSTWLAWANSLPIALFRVLPEIWKAEPVKIDLKRTGRKLLV